MRDKKQWYLVVAAKRQPAESTPLETGQDRWLTYAAEVTPQQALWDRRARYGPLWVTEGRSPYAVVERTSRQFH
jgi:hypothetical protein